MILLNIQILSFSILIASYQIAVMTGADNKPTLGPTSLGLGGALVLVSCEISLGYSSVLIIASGVIIGSFFAETSILLIMSCILARFTITSRQNNIHNKDIPLDGNGKRRLDFTTGITRCVQLLQGNFLYS